LGINQQKLVDLLEVSRPTISHIENGKRKVSADELIKLSEIFNLSVERPNIGETVIYKLLYFIDFNFYKK